MSTHLTFFPARLRLADALRVVLGRPCMIASLTTTLDELGKWVGAPPAIQDPAEAWERLAVHGLLSMDAVDDPGRAFWRPADCGFCGRVVEHGRAIPGVAGLAYDCPEHGYPDDLPAARSYPRSVAECVALAADWPGVLAAEALAREAAHRLRPWGAPAPATVLWRVVDPATWAPRGRHSPTARRHWRLAAAATRPVTRNAGGPTPRAFDACERDDWAHAAAQDAKVCARDPIPHAGERIAAFANPWEPVCAIWDLGYALDEVADDALALACPRLRSPA